LGGALGLGGEGAPIACLDSVVRSRYKSWHRKNAKEVSDLKGLAATNRWKLIVASRDSVKALSLADSELETIYSTKNRISYAGLQRGGKVALIETRRRIDPRGDKAFVVVLEGGREMVRIPLSEVVESGCYLGGDPVLATGDYVIFPDGDRVSLYSVDDEKKRQLFETEEGSYLLTVCEAKGLWYFVVVDPQRSPANSEMIVLKGVPPFERIHSVPEVTNIMVVGEHIVLEKGGEIVKYSPETGQTEFLWRGTLLAAVDNCKFLFTASTWKISRFGWLVLDFSLREYELLEGKTREIAGDFSIDTCYGASYPLVSPDSQHVLVSDNAESALVDSEYLVYDITSGEKAGAFYEPYMGKHYFKHVLGWTD
jgi:hypothetical protein